MSKRQRSLRLQRSVIAICTLYITAFAGVISSTAQINATMEFEGVIRSYIYYIPDSAPDDEPLPLVFALHGFTQNASQMMNGSRFNEVADTAHFIVVYPNGINNAWNTNTGLPGGSTANDIGFINALMDTLILNHKADPNRIYTCGFSNGGFMSHALACQSGHRFAAIASVAGTMTNGTFNNCSPSVPIPVMQIHGTTDAIVNYNGGSTVEAVIYSDGPDNPEVRLLRILGGGHTWPGFTGFFGLGNVNQDIRAEVEIWNFFSRFSLESTNSIQPVVKDTFAIFPNPAGSYINLDNEDVGQIELFTMQGVLAKVFWGTGPHNLSYLEAGTYLLKAYLKEGAFLGSQRIVIMP
jgi:polyhydroxybutyrate depolymerase